MDFFKSILSDDPEPDPPLPKKPQDSSPEQSPEKEVDPDQNLEKPNSRSDSTADDGGDGGVWSFGGLLKTLSTRSESVLETYRRDLQEFGSGLKKETELFREVASRAVKDLPNSIEVGTTVSHAIDGVIKSTTEIISQGKDTLLASSDAEPETPDANRTLNSGRYSRFESQLMNIQSDPNTFCMDPEDLEEYKKWKSEFELKEKSKEVEILIEENGSLEGIYKRVVPNEVDNETFWCRYFYKVYKLKQQESVRANLVKRAISIDDEEELSWDVDDEDDNEQESIAKSKVDEKGKEENQSNVDGGGKSKVVESVENNKDSKKEDTEVTLLVKKEEGVVKGSEGKTDKDGSGKNGDVSIASSQKTGADEDDLDWDEIEDVDGIDDKKATSHVASSNRDDLRKRLSVEEDDEDLSWD
ncbi:hypothetical protein MTR67_040891 [Solanum verrucosum]|uniref:BSD domain-containing protein n=1 Tax=Solanum verrucosum TaxID=315347 RepID=A0AAF0ZQ84_SOLVR|nr:hypothetical protein MTR67_040891 [Solanum verrucosum]